MSSEELWDMLNEASTNHHMESDEAHAIEEAMNRAFNGEYVDNSDVN